jgi:hypothetical protein
MFTQCMNCIVLSFNILCCLTSKEVVPYIRDLAGDGDPCNCMFCVSHFQEVYVISDPVSHAESCRR